jgi:pimeloyl-ACP methyl ester carboxylesterase
MSDLYFLRQGAGEPTVLLHGIGSRAEVWQPVMAGLAESRDVIAVDLPGFGRSPLGPSRPTVEGIADQITAFCSRLGLSRPHVAGSSLGGAVALELGRRGAARSVTAFAPIGFWAAPGAAWCRSVLAAMRRAAPPTRRALPALLALRAGRRALFPLFYGDPGRVSAATLLADADAFAAAEALGDALSAMSRYRFPDTVRAGLGCLDDIPVTVAWGAADRLLPCRTQARRAWRALPRARHVVLPGCGHIPFYDDPVGCLMVLRGDWRAPALRASTADAVSTVGAAGTSGTSAISGLTR